MSPSLWFEDWFKFMNNHHANLKDSFIYLSLGDLEEKSTTKPLDIGINVKKMYEIVKKDSNVKDSIYELNKGGHFNDGEERTSKGFAWLLERV
jgi:predicted alpha/beta superfamily hydrolase